MEDSRVLEALKKSEEDSNWVSEEYGRLRSKYEGKVFAVKGKRIISYADTMEELMKKLEQVGEDASLLLIESIPPRDLLFIL
jgi:hypothetical protein